MSNFIQQETETKQHFIITCEICGARVDEPTEASAVHVATQTGEILTMRDGRRVFLCVDCLVSPAAGHYTGGE